MTPDSPSSSRPCNHPLAALAGRARPQRLRRPVCSSVVLFAMGLAALSGSLACGDGSDTTRLGAREDPDGPLPPPDQLENGSLRLDAEGVTGQIDGGRFLVARIPVRALRAGGGSLVASLRSVDGAQVHDTQRLRFELARGDTQRLEARLRLPEALAGQADLVRYNLVVRGDDELRLTRSALHVVPPYEVRVEGPQRLSAEKQVSYRVSARNAITQEPLAEQGVELSLVAPDGSREPHRVTTDRTGTATLELEVDEPGEYAVQASADAFGVAAAVAESVEVEPVASRVLLTTDKPIYQPGQTLHLRALSLARADRKPNGDVPVRFEIEDGKGNKILQRDVTADDYGIAATDFALGTILNEGTFQVRAISGDATTEKSVEVFRYALPKYRVGIQTDRPWYLPGQTVTARLDARYFFGRPVADAAVVVELGAVVVGEEIFRRVQSRTSADGALEVSLELPSALPGLDINSGNALAFLRVTATDGAGQQVVQQQALSVARQPLLLSVVPEAGKLVAGVENLLSVFVTDPLGAPVAGAEVTLDLGSGAGESLTTDAYGHGSVRWRPPQGAPPVGVRARAGGESVSEQFRFDEQAGGEALLVRTDRAVYEVGEEVEVEVVTGAEVVYVDWLNDGQAVDMRTLEVEAGRATFRVPVDTGLLGDNRIEAYVVDDSGNLSRAGRTIFARGSSSLQIAVQPDAEQYAPGESARLTFSVTDEAGQPAVAALGVQIVDEAVFAVTDAQPGLLRTYFELQDEFAQPSYQIRPPGGNLGALLLDDTAAADEDARQAAQARAAANLAALGDAPITGLFSGSWSGVVSESQQRLEPFLERGKQVLLDRLGRAVVDASGDLRDRGCRSDQYSCEALGRSYFEALRDQVRQTFSANDFWGNPFDNQPMAYDELARLLSAGPDERAGTPDDVTISIHVSELMNSPVARSIPDLERAIPPALEGEGVAQPGGDAEFDNGAGEPTVGGAGGSGGSGGDDGGPRVRRDFPETLYVNPSLITDGSGTASIDVPLADSITQWRVSTLGHTRGGQLGGSASGITVFQDFFVDVNFPATLTRGDEVDFPVAIYNYLDTAQEVSLSLEAADWYTPLGATSLTVELGPGEVRGVSLPVRVEQVGLQTLTLTGSGSQRADAVARQVRVLPDGKAFPEALSGSMEPGSTTHTLSFPAQAVAGSEQMYLQVFPAFLSQAVSGMDSVLQVPSGCFEQTTSTTWPNVLVTRYMEETGQITPEIQVRAQSLISQGYQRLLTFEHPGGGYSWFGTQDPAPFLSVTAFGLMEFADMKAVHAVDEAMIARTQQWLVEQQRADGSWQGDTSEFFSFHTSEVRNTAFVLWALAENGYNGPALQRGLQFVKQNLAGGSADERDDPYTLALVANAMALVGDSDTGDVLATLDGLRQQQEDRFFWGTDLQTNFYGGGNDANVSATALVAHAMIRDGSYPATVEGALAYLTAAKDPNGNFGSTQATTWSLKALLLAATRGTDGAVGSLTVSVDGSEFAEVDLLASAPDVMTTVDMSALATTGDHDVQLSFAGTGRVSYSLVGSHHLPWAEVSEPPAGPLGIAVAYESDQLQVDDTVTATVAVTNNTPAALNMVLVTVGIPPGFEVQLADFDGYLSDGVLSRAEVTGRQLNLYVSELGGSATQQFEYRLLATLPVRASDGGAEASLYYEPDQKAQAPATTLVATAP